MLIRELIETYVRAKDQTRPYEMARVFTPDVNLTMNVLTREIEFPPQAQGLQSVAKILCSDLNRRFENILTFCLSEPPGDTADSYKCEWIVVMSEKEGGQVRVGGGIYEWNLDPSHSLISSFVITVKGMGTLSIDHLPQITEWVRQLDYPWTTRPRIEASGSTIEGLIEILRQVWADG
jgi:hypothetical protein